MFCRHFAKRNNFCREEVPAGTQHQNDVVSTSMRRDHVASTLIRRHINVVCPLGVASLVAETFQYAVILPQRASSFL